MVKVQVSMEGRKYSSTGKYSAKTSDVKVLSRIVFYRLTVTVFLVSLLVTMIAAPCIGAVMRIDFRFCRTSYTTLQRL